MLARELFGEGAGDDEDDNLEGEAGGAGGNGTAADVDDELPQSPLSHAHGAHGDAHGGIGGADDEDNEDADDLADFIVETIGEDGQPVRARPRGARGAGRGISGRALKEASAIFGDVPDFMQPDADEVAAGRGKQRDRMAVYREQYEPAVLEERYFTERDELVRTTDLPEREQLARVTAAASIATGAGAGTSDKPPEAPRELEEGELLKVTFTLLPFTMPFLLLSLNSLSCCLICMYCFSCSCSRVRM